MANKHLRRFHDLGIDLDIGPKQDLRSFDKFHRAALKRAKKFGYVMDDKLTKHGRHLKVQLFYPVDFWRAIEIRYEIGDDPRRLFYDIMRWRSGGQMIDTLFDEKKTGTPITVEEMQG